MAKEETSVALKPGSLLQSKEGTYEIVRVLGSGSFGITYLAKSIVMHGNISITVHFAIKEHFLSASCFRGEDGITVNTVPAAKTDVKNSKADFITEANRLKENCNKSRNIVSVNEVFEANGTAYYVMEYLDGGNPAKCSEQEAVSIVVQVADALRVIHEEHILHLDVKPDNIVMKTNDKQETYPVLIDFGIAKHFDNKGRPTSNFNVKGASPGFAPQEQYAGVKKFSPKYDIYALGAVLYFLVTGKYPPDAFEVSVNQQELKKELEGKVSSKVEKAILNAMKPTAEDRTATIEQFCNDLVGEDFVPVLNTEVSNVSFKKEKQKRYVTIDSNIGWSAFSDENWCKVSRAGNQLEITVTKNKEITGRTCEITIHGNPYQLSQTIFVRQEGVGTIVMPSGPSKWEQLLAAISKNRKLIYLACGAAVLIGGVIAICIIIPSESEKEVDKAAENIEAVDEVAAPAQEENMEQPEDLTTVAEEEIIIQAPKDSVWDPSKDMAPTVTETNDQKFARAKNNFNLMLSLANDNYTKAYYPVAKMYYDRGDKSNAEKWARKAVSANVNKSAAQALIDKIIKPEATPPANPSTSGQPSTPITPTNKVSLDDLYKNAKTVDDYKALADKGYSKAYAPLADIYLYNRKYDLADSYARKALNANVGRQKAIEVVEKLDKLGYYRGNKPSY